jgi:oligoendopeptidase F
MIGQSVETGARASLVSFTRSLERVRRFRELLQTLDSFIGRNQTQDIVDDSLNSASEQGHNATHDASVELSRLMALLCLADLVLF